MTPMAARHLLLLSVALLLAAPVPTPGPQQDCVILLHGLGRTSRSFDKMETFFRNRGYWVINLDYPSREQGIRRLSDSCVAPMVEGRLKASTGPIHFVTHSMGGILVRQYLKDHPSPRIGRVVMLSPPNRGSEVPDLVGRFPFLARLMGPALPELSAKPGSYVNTLGKPAFELGIITGRKSVNWINSLVIPGADDGKVSVERARLDGMRDFLVVDRTHPLIMQADEVMEAADRFLKTGAF